MDNAKDNDVVMPMYNLIEYSDNYSKTLGSLCQYYRDELALTDAGALENFSCNSRSFKFKKKISGSSVDDGVKTAKVMILLKHLSNFWRTPEVSLINCENIVILTWSVNCFVSNAAANQKTTFAKTDTRLYAPVVTLSTQDNAQL